jgi:hypothetical protein
MLVAHAGGGQVAFHGLLRALVQRSGPCPAAGQLFQLEMHRDRVHLVVGRQLQRDLVV